MIKQLPALIKQNDETKQEINELKKKLDDIIQTLSKKQNIQGSVNQLPSNEIEDSTKEKEKLNRPILEEMEDRSRRTRNVVFWGILENGDPLELVSRVCSKEFNTCLAQDQFEWARRL